MSSDYAAGVLAIYILVGIVCGGFAMAIAMNRGRSGAWFFAGLFFGPLGVFAALIAPRGFTTPRGMQSVTCARCSARQNIATDSTLFECWQCKRQVSLTR